MEPGAGFVVGVGVKFIEFLVCFGFDVLSVFQPYGFYRVDTVTVQMYGKGDKAGIALEDPFDCGTLGKVSMIVFEGEYDSTAAALALGFFDCIAAKTVARPANARGAFSPYI